MPLGMSFDEPGKALGNAFVKFQPHDGAPAVFPQRHNDVLSSLMRRRRIHRQRTVARNGFVVGLFLFRIVFVDEFIEDSAALLFRQRFRRLREDLVQPPRGEAASSARWKPAAVMLKCFASALRL